jgi:photosynthetic reaction center H subunit
MREQGNRRPYPLDELDDYEVADHDPDVRGWTVYSADGLEVGEVEELIVDPAAKKVRYLAVDLKHDDDSPSAARRVAVPVGAARLRGDDDDVVLDNMQASEIATLPAYRDDAFDDAYETDVRARFGRGTTRQVSARPGDSGWYDDEMYDDRRFYGSRRR